MSVLFLIGVQSVSMFCSITIVHVRACRERKEKLLAVNFCGLKFSLTTLCHLMLCGCEVLGLLCMMSVFPTEWPCTCVGGGGGVGS